jgi:hypothetical protein
MGKLSFGSRSVILLCALPPSYDEVAVLAGDYTPLPTLQIVLSKKLTSPEASRYRVFFWGASPPANTFVRQFQRILLRVQYSDPARQTKSHTVILLPAKEPARMHGFHSL